MTFHRFGPSRPSASPCRSARIRCWDGRRALRLVALAVLGLQLASGCSHAQSDGAEHGAHQTATATAQPADATNGAAAAASPTSPATPSSPSGGSATAKVPPPKGDAKPAAALDPSVGTDWVRVEYDDKGKPRGMQTAIVRYAGPARAVGAAPHDVEVDLIGAVHVGDFAYYRQLNKQFVQYDALLYELVAPPGTTVERGRGTSNTHPVGALQNGLKTMLDLEHQLEEVDYTKPNFIHADMSPDQFAKAMRDRNESFLQMYFRLLGAAIAQQSQQSGMGQASEFDLLAALFSSDRPRRLKIILAKQLADMESLMVSFGGEQGSAIISDRNQMALKVLKEQIAAGKTRLGIFYGAGHLRDMDERLRKDFGLKPVAITWVTAWNLAERP